MYILYDFIFLLFSIIYLPYLVLTRRYHSRIFERFGIFNKPFFESLKEKEVIWLHAVSVGEVIAASPFIKEFHKNFPNYKLLISTVTKTGNSIASRVKMDEDFLIYFPLDLSFVIRNLLKRINVRLLIIMETEIWPNTISAFNKKRIPIILINGRLSQKSFNAYRKIKFLLKNVFGGISLFCMQTQMDANRLKGLGVYEEKIKITGNMKYDATELALPGEDDRPLWIKDDEGLFVAGSTHPGEEEIILDAYKKILQNFPKLKLLIAPRHVTRVEEIERLVSRYNLKCKRFSWLQKSTEETDVIILDVMGKLKSLYALSGIVFMGGSLFSHYGGHNILEPASFKKPVLFGPYMANFKSMADEFLNRGAAIEVKDSDGIKRACSELLSSPSRIEEIGEIAFNIIEENKGAVLRNTQYIKNILLG